MRGLNKGDRSKFGRSSSGRPEGWELGKLKGGGYQWKSNMKTILTKKLRRDTNVWGQWGKANNSLYRLNAKSL